MKCDLELLKNIEKTEGFWNHWRLHFHFLGDFVPVPDNLQRIRVRNVDYTCVFVILSSLREEKYISLIFPN